MMAIKNEIIKTLPAAPGVYIFKNDEGLPLYIGKSKNIVDRVRSHIYSSKRDPKESKICENSTSISFIRTAGELGALIRESILVKQLSPLYNRKLRKRKTVAAAKSFFNEFGYLTVALEDVPAKIDSDELDSYLMISSSRHSLKLILEDAAREFKLCSKLLSLEKGKGSCFNYMLRRCNGACMHQEPSSNYNSRLKEAFEKLSVKKWPFDGEIEIVERFDDMHEVIKIYNWCVTGADFTTEYEEKYLASNRLFDLDSYKIIKGYLASGRYNTENLHLV